MASIKEWCGPIARSTCINREVTRCWLNGCEGCLEPTCIWDALEDVLCKIGKKVLAEDLISKLKQHDVHLAMSSCP